MKKKLQTRSDFFGQISLKKYIVLTNNSIWPTEHLLDFLWKWNWENHIFLLLMHCFHLHNSFHYGIMEGLERAREECRWSANRKWGALRLRCLFWHWFHGDDFHDEWLSKKIFFLKIEDPETCVLWDVWYIWDNDKNRLNWTGKVHDLDMSTMSMSGSGCVTWGEGGRWSWIRKNFYCGRADGRQTGTTDLTRHDIWRSVRMSAGFCPTVLAKLWGRVGISARPLLPLLDM